jgi:O-methyltransferase domain/Dimerisation domain
MAQNKTADSATEAPGAVIRAMIEGLRIAQILYVAAQLGLADYLKDGPRGCDELAHATDSHGPTLRRILRALASIGILAQDDQQRFSLTPIGELLRSDTADSLRDLVLNALAEERYRAWGGVMHTVKTGETAFDHVFGVGVWQYRAAHAEFGALFDKSIATFTAHVQAALEAYPFGNFKTIVDVAGGNGSLMTAILQAHPSVRGAIVDLPRVAEQTRRRIAAAGLTDRCDVIGGDAFQDLPAGADGYILSTVIHDWDDQHSIALLRSCRRAMTPNSWLVLIERLLPKRSDSSLLARPVVMSDLNMMVMTGGHERTVTEYEALLQAAGFALTKVTPTDSIMSVIEAKPLS